MEWITTRAVLRCGHDGRVENVPSQHWVKVGGDPVLVDNDPEGKTIRTCPNIGPTMKPCTRSLTVTEGYSGWLRIGGQRVAHVHRGRADRRHRPGHGPLHRARPRAALREVGPMSRDRAFRFDGAGLTARAGGLTVTPTGAVAMVEGDLAIRQAILLLLSTAPGERLMRPDYGSHLNRLLFAPNDQTTAGLAIHYVRQAMDRWEPRVEIVDLDAEPDPDRVEQLTIRLVYRVRASLSVDILEYPLDLASTGGSS